MLISRFEVEADEFSFGHAEFQRHPWEDIK